MQVHYLNKSISSIYWLQLTPNVFGRLPSNMPPIPRYYQIVNICCSVLRLYPLTGLFYGASDRLNLIMIEGGKRAFSHNPHNSNGPGNAKFMQPYLLS